MLKLEHFRYIMEIARTGSINRAAENLLFSQPYLSAELNKLEQELGVKLLQRSNRGVKLTGAGLQFLDYARQIDALVNKAQRLSGAGEARDEKETLHVYSIYSFTMMDLFHTFSEQHQDLGCVFSYEELANDLIPDKVSGQRGAVGIVFLVSSGEAEKRIQLAQKHLVFQELCREILCAVVSRDHPLSGKEWLQLSELEPYPLLVEKLKLPRRAEHPKNLLFPHLFDGFALEPVVFDNNRSLMYYLTKSSRCFTIGQKSLNLTNPFVRSGDLKYIPLTGSGCYLTTGYVVDRDAPASPAVQAYTEFLKQYFARYHAGQTLRGPGPDMPA